MKLTLRLAQLIVNIRKMVELTDLFIDMTIRFGRAFTLRTVGGADAE